MALVTQRAFSNVKLSQSAAFSFNSSSFFIADSLKDLCSAPMLFMTKRLLLKRRQPVPTVELQP
ncbi:hypothetical protein OIU74_023469, partial [Salix koriyanagi]